MLTTTLNKIYGLYPCETIWRKLLSSLGKTQADDEPLPYSTILKAVGLEDALWTWQSTPEHAKEQRLFAVWCAKQTIHLAADNSSIRAVAVAERFAEGLASKEELDEAMNAALNSAMSILIGKDESKLAALDAGTAAVSSARADACVAAILAEASITHGGVVGVQEKEFLRVVSSAN